MKNSNKLSFANQIILALIVFTLSACTSNRSVVTLTPKQKVVIDYPSYDVFSAQLKNAGFSAIDVSVNSKDSGTKIRSFGLNAMGNAKIMVEQENELTLYNPSDKTVRVKFSIEKTSRAVYNKQEVYRTLTLENKSTRSIPLIIPTVMNPNLSPLSRSGVDLKMGQKVYFKAKGKKYMLFEVDDTIQNGDIIDVARLLENRKTELGIG